MMKSSRWLSLLLAMGLSVLTNCTRDFTGDPPENLEIQARFVDSDGSSDGKIVVAVQFFQQDKLVELTSGATIRCNDTELAHTSLGYGGRVDAVAPGGTYAVTHQLPDGEVTTLRVPVPQRPQITAPTAGAQLARTNDQVIVFASGGGSVTATAVGPAGSATGQVTPDASGMASVNPSTVGAGNGSLILTRELQGGVDGTGFASASFIYSIEKKLPVVWQ